MSTERGKIFYSWRTGRDRVGVVFDQRHRPNVWVYHPYLSTVSNLKEGEKEYKTYADMIVLTASRKTVGMASIPLFTFIRRPSAFQRCRLEIAGRYRLGIVPPNLQSPETHCEMMVRDKATCYVKYGSNISCLSAVASSSWQGCSAVQELECASSRISLTSSPYFHSNPEADRGRHLSLGLAKVSHPLLMCYSPMALQKHPPDPCWDYYSYSIHSPFFLVQNLPADD